MIDFEARGHVALITINRPEARNAINGAVAAGLQAAVERLEADPRPLGRCASPATARSSRPAPT